MNTLNHTRSPSVPTFEEIAQRAHEIYLERGAKPGHELDDWLQAEYELMKLPVNHLAKISKGKTARKVGRRLAIIGLVQAAMFWGTSGMSPMNR